MSGELQKGWALAPISGLVRHDGLMCDGNWVESKDQDPAGDVRLIQLADVGAGGFLNKSNRFLTSGKAISLGCTFLRAGDVLIARLGERLGKSCTFPGLDQRCVTVVDVHIFRAGTADVSHRWLMHIMNAPGITHSLEAQSSGTTRKRITGQKIRDQGVPVPPAREQRAIASRVDELLSRIDDGETSLERARVLLEHYRQSVLKAAVTGELTRKWREMRKVDSESGEGLLHRILKARREGQAQHRLREGRARSGSANIDYDETLPSSDASQPRLPAGWVWSSIGQLFHVSTGSTPSRKEPSYWDGEIPWVSSGEVAFCRIKATRETISKSGLDNSSVHLHPAGTVLLAMIGEGKTRGQAAILDIEACNNQNAAAIDVSATPIPPEYVYRYLEHRYDSVRAIGQGGNQPALNAGLVRRIPLPLPSLEEISQICVEIERYFALADSLSSIIGRQPEASAVLRQSILHAAFTGRLLPQDPNDEPATVLLERIAAERAAAKVATKPTRARRNPRK